MKWSEISFVKGADKVRRLISRATLQPPHCTVVERKSCFLPVITSSRPESRRHMKARIGEPLAHALLLRTLEENPRPTPCSSEENPHPTPCSSGP
ncbi:unnamed protein product [Merluccius merluccius]